MIKPTECRSCGAEIVFLKTEKGSLMPVDADTWTEGEELFDAHVDHVAHFITCGAPER